MIIRRIFYLTLLLIIASASGCSPPSIPAPAIKSPLITPELPPDLPASKIPGQAEWERVIKAAQKEGVVRIYQRGGERGEALTRGGFQEKYGVAVEGISGRGNELAAKILSERRAGIYQADLITAGADTMLNRLIPSKALDPIEPTFMLPELVDSELFKKTWRLPEFVFIEPQHLFFIFSYYSSPAISINTDLVRPEQIKVWRDVLSPRWKGKISIQDPTTSGQGGSWFGETMETLQDAEDFIRALVKQEPFITRDSRLQLQWLAQGKHAIGIAAAHGVVPEFIKAGAPIKYHEILETVSVTSGSSIIALVNRAPHPNAARLFINWLLSREGQKAYSQASWQPSLRLDVTVEGIDPITIPRPGVKYFNSVTPEFRRKLNEKYHQLAREIFEPLMK